MDKPFPWKCPMCRKQTVNAATIEYHCKKLHNGVLHEFDIPDLEVARCDDCGEVLFHVGSDEQINKNFQQLLDQMKN